MPEKTPQISYISSLQIAGLSPEQATIYECLLRNGPLPAGKIHIKTPYKRGLVYKILEQLEDSGVVIKNEQQGKVAIFEPAHPLKLKELAEKKEEQARLAQTALSGVLDQMTMDFNLVSEKPGVRLYEGIEGLQKTYDEILKYAKHVKIFASNLDAKDPKIAELIREQAKKQKRLNITVQALNSGDPSEEHVIERNSLQELGITSKYIKSLTIPSQIVIFDEYVSISSLSNELVTTIIQNKAIAQSFEIIFDSLWNLAT